MDFIPVSITIASVFLSPYPSPHSLSAVGYRCTHIPCSCPVPPRPVSGLHFTPPRHSHRSPRPTYTISTPVFALTPKKLSKEAAKGCPSHSFSPIPNQSSVTHHQQSPAMRLSTTLPLILFPTLTLAHADRIHPAHRRHLARSGSGGYGKRAPALLDDLSGLLDGDSGSTVSVTCRHFCPQLIIKHFQSSAASSTSTTSSAPSSSSSSQSSVTPTSTAVTTTSRDEVTSTSVASSSLPSTSSASPTSTSTTSTEVSSFTAGPSENVTSSTASSSDCKWHKEHA